MAGSTTITGSQRERLHQEFMAEANRLFERMFDSDEQAELVTFTQRETRAMELGRVVSQWLVEEHVAADPASFPSQQSDGKTPCCPKCGKAGVLMTQESEELPGREVVSRAGLVRLERERYRCTTCRVVFFPSGREVGVDQ